MSIDFSPRAVIQAARERSGLADFGDEGFLEALTVYLDRLAARPAPFSEGGAQMAFQEVVSALENRLRIADFIRRHPEVEEQPIRRPVFITGLYRTGTTKLQNLLCADPRWLCLRTWQTMRPVPMDGARAGEEDPRIAVCRAGLKHLEEAAPHAARAHPLGATDPSEEYPLMTPSFRLVDAKQIGTGFGGWAARQDNVAMYRDLRRALQVLQHQFARPGEEQRFCLKAPAHLGNIKLLLQVFPDAKVIFTHRDPYPAITSFAALRASLAGMYASKVDLEAVADDALDQAAEALERSLAARRALPADRFFEISFGDIVGRALERAADIYEHVGAELDGGTREALAAADSEPEAYRSRAEPIDPARYGLSRERIYGRTRGYLDWARGTVGEMTSPGP